MKNSKQDRKQNQPAVSGKFQGPAICTGHRPKNALPAELEAAVNSIVQRLADYRVDGGAL